jgi:hypothetical protein
MIDRSTPLQVPGRMADRQAEARAHRHAAEASSAAERTFWLTDGIRAIAGSGRSVVTGVRKVRVVPGATLSPLRYRP